MKWNAHAIRESNMPIIMLINHMVNVRTLKIQQIQIHVGNATRSLYTFILSLFPTFKSIALFSIYLPCGKNWTNTLWMLHNFSRCLSNPLSFPTVGFGLAKLDSKTFNLTVSWKENGGLICKQQTNNSHPQPVNNNTLVKCQYMYPNISAPYINSCI